MRVAAALRGNHSDTVHGLVRPTARLAQRAVHTVRAMCPARECLHTTGMKEVIARTRPMGLSRIDGFRTERTKHVLYDIHTPGLIYEIFQ